MRHRKLQNYLRTYRKRSGLSQKEIAFLLGCKSSAKISHYECFTRQPNIQTAFALAVIFDAPPHDLFAGLFQEVQQQIVQRAQLLSLKIEVGSPHRTVTAKQAILLAITKSKSKPSTR